MRAKFAKVGEVSTRYLTAGEPTDAPLAFVHGIGVNAEMWFRNLDALSTDHWVIAPDLLGHGFTETTRLDGAPQGEMVAHLIGFLDLLGVEKCSIVGSSFGGALSCIAALEAPSRFEKLVVVSSGSVYNDAQQLSTTLDAAKANGLSAMNEASVSACRERLARIHYRRSTVPEEVLLSQVTSYARPGVKAFYADCLDRYKAMVSSPSEERDRFFVRDRLASIQVPVLIVAGREDPRASVEQAYRVQEMIPNCELVVFDECGHEPHVEQPNRFNQVVRQFLAA